MVPVPMGVGSPPTEPSRVVPPGRVDSPVQLRREEFREDLVAAPVADSPVRFQEGRGVRLPMDREAFPDRLPPVGCREVNPVRSRGALAARLRTDPAVFRGRLLAAGSRARSPVVLPMERFPAGGAGSRGMVHRVLRGHSRAAPRPVRCRAEGRGSRGEPPVVRGPAQGPAQDQGPARADSPVHPQQAGCPAMPWPRVEAPGVALPVAWVALPGGWRGGWGRWEPLAECREECREEWR
jgi:hypothetical protein